MSRAFLPPHRLACQKRPRQPLTAPVHREGRELHEEKIIRSQRRPSTGPWQATSAAERRNAESRMMTTECRLGERRPGIRSGRPDEWRCRVKNSAPTGLMIHYSRLCYSIIESSAASRRRERQEGQIMKPKLHASATSRQAMSAAERRKDEGRIAASRYQWTNLNREVRTAPLHLALNSCQLKIARRRLRYRRTRTLTRLAELVGGNDNGHGCLSLLCPVFQGRAPRESRRWRPRNAWGRDAAHQPNGFQYHLPLMRFM